MGNMVKVLHVILLTILQACQRVSSQTTSLGYYGVDVVFLLDTSASMEEEQARIRDNAALLFQTLNEETNGAFRVGIVGFGRGGVRKNLSLTTDQQAFIDAVTGLANGGGAEPGFTAITRTTTDTLQSTRTDDGFFMEGFETPTGDYPQPFSYCPIMVTDEASNNDDEGIDLQSTIDTMNAARVPFLGFTAFDDNSNQAYGTLTEQTGGLRTDIDLFIQSPSDTLVEMLRACVTILKSQGFVPPGSPTVGPTFATGMPTIPSPGPPTPGGPSNGNDPLCSNLPQTCPQQTKQFGFVPRKGKGQPSYKGKGKGKGQTMKSKGKGSSSRVMKSKGKGKGDYIRKRHLNKKNNKSKSSLDYSYYHNADDGSTQDSLVSICYHDPVNRVYTTECVDRDRDLAFLSTHFPDSYSCGCCSPDQEFSGMPPEYCGMQGSDFASGTTSFSSSMSIGEAVFNESLDNSSTDKPLFIYRDDLGCPAQALQPCSRPDVFVHGRMMSVCHQDVITGISETLCLHPAVDNHLNPHDRYTCGCCDDSAEQHRPWYCYI